MKLYGLKNCDSCRKAKKELEAAGNELEFIDVRATPLDEATLEGFLSAFGADKLVNKKSTTWRQLDEVERAKNPLQLLVENPSLMKRPVIETDKGCFLAWTADTKSHLL